MVVPRLQKVLQGDKMTREQKVNDLADNLVRLLREQTEAIYASDGTHTVYVAGKINLLPIAEWMLRRMA